MTPTEYKAAMVELFGESSTSRVTPKSPNREMAELLGVSYAHARKLACGAKNLTDAHRKAIHNERHRRKALEFVSQ